MPCTSDGYLSTYPSAPRAPRPSTREKELKAELDEVTRLLCTVLGNLESSGVIVEFDDMTDEEIRAWWEEHKKLDAARLERLRQEALKKLDPEEIEALGLGPKKGPTGTRHK